MIMSTHQIKSNQRQPIISQTEDITIFNQSISVNLIIMYPNTGEKLEIYDQPTGKNDAIAMQHDVNYAVCKDKKKMQE